MREWKEKMAALNACGPTDGSPPPVRPVAIGSGCASAIGLVGILIMLGVLAGVALFGGQN